MEENILYIIAIIVILVIAVSLGGFAIYVNITYGSLPINEVPSWAIRWLLK